MIGRKDVHANSEPGPAVLRPADAGGKREIPWWSLLTIAVATGSLLYLVPWFRLRLIPGDIEYHVDVVMLNPAILATALNTLFAAIVTLFLVGIGLRNRARHLGRACVWFALGLFWMGALRVLLLFFPHSDLKVTEIGNWVLLGGAFAVGLGGVLVSTRRPGFMSRALAISSPASVIWLTIFGAMIAPVVMAFRLDTSLPPSRTNAQPPAESTSLNAARGVNEAGSRPISIVWVIFDEFDASVGFDHRPASLNVPHIDRFRREAVNFSRAYSPSDFTVTAVPSLLTGEQLSHVAQKGHADILLEAPGTGKIYSFRESPNVITWARNADVPVTVVGWTHPYCRVFGDQLAQCAWQENDFMSMSQISALPYRRMSLWDGAVAQAAQEALPATGDPCVNQSPSSTLAREAYEGIRERMRSMVLQQRRDVHRFLRSGFSGLRILHLATPHPPPITQRDPESSSGSIRGDASIAANFGVADTIFGEIQTILRERGEWDDSLVILTSDHGLRSFWEELGCLSAEDAALLVHRNEFHVPLMIKWPNATESMEIDHEVSTLLVAPLIRGYLEGRTRSWEEFVAFVGEQKRSGERNAAN